jgi:RNA polymerase sigma-70 factor (ECF subfamily)
LKEDGESADVIQQAYVNAYSHLRQVDGRSQFSTWLTRIAFMRPSRGFAAEGTVHEHGPKNPSISR